MNADGAGLIDLTNGPAEDRLPAWSTDGENIAFTSVSVRNSEINIVRVDGSGLERLTDNPTADLGLA
jgi:Tol biopolymer transport system component